MKQHYCPKCGHSWKLPNISRIAWLEVINILKCLNHDLEEAGLVPKSYLEAKRLIHNFEEDTR